MRISDWSSDVCSSDLETRRCPALSCCSGRAHSCLRLSRLFSRDQITIDADQVDHEQNHILRPDPLPLIIQERSEEHTSELQSLMRISYAVFCLKKKNTHQIANKTQTKNKRRQPHSRQKKQD